MNRDNLGDHLVAAMERDAWEVVRQVGVGVPNGMTASEFVLKACRAAGVGVSKASCLPGTIDLLEVEEKAGEIAQHMREMSP